MGAEKLSSVEIPLQSVLQSLKRTHNSVASLSFSKKSLEGKSRQVRIKEEERRVAKTQGLLKKYCNSKTFFSYTLDCYYVYLEDMLNNINQCTNNNRRHLNSKNISEHSLRMNFISKEILEFKSKLFFDYVDYLRSKYYNEVVTKYKKEIEEEFLIIKERFNSFSEEISDMEELAQEIKLLYKDLFDQIESMLDDIEKTEDDFKEIGG